MKRTALILLLMLISVLLEPLGAWETNERSLGVAETAASRIADGRRIYPALTIPLAGGNFKLKDLQLSSVGRSTKLSGRLVNETQQQWDIIVFAVKAYDRSGRQLRGVERETVFGFNQLGKGKSAAINSGYGVWLEGIPFKAIARVEVVLLDAPRAAHSKTMEKLSRIEE